jgi:transcriptional regulator with GAF, ATPase, and Fis domain
LADLEQLEETLMNSTATWGNEELKGLPETGSSSESSTSPGNITTVKELVLRLLCELQCIAEVNTLSIGEGIDFYDEVSRFEIDLIKRALLQTGGHQVQAAKLLNMKVTTLNSKIKHYNISASGFANVYPILDTHAVDDRAQSLSGSGSLAQI